MRKKGRTIYQIARLSTDMTQEKVAEMLHISMKSIGAYERGETIPPDDIVCSMVTIYKAPWLAYTHLKLNNEVGKNYLPDIEFRELSANILDLQLEMAEAAKSQCDIAIVGRDNKIDADEQPIWNECMKKIEKLIGAAFAVLLSPLVPLVPTQKEKTPVLEHRRFNG